MFKDLQGQQFGRLIVLYCETKTNNQMTTKWACHCQCDDDKGQDYVSCYKTTRTLLVDKTKSCGCLIKERTSKVLIKDLSNQRFGRLLVIKDSGKRFHGSVVWTCHCDCGNDCDIPATSLVNGNTKSCGCLHSDIIRKQQSVNITNKRFGRLIAREPKIIDGILQWRCECDCGNKEFYSTVRALQSGNTKSCGCLKSLGESTVAQLLTEHGISFRKEYTFDDCRNPETGSLLRFDFYLPDYNCCIEYDGSQHFYSKNCGWNNEQNYQATVYRDRIKDDYCIKAGIILLRIPYYDLDCLDIDYILDKIK